MTLQKPCQTMLHSLPAPSSGPHGEPRAIQTPPVLMEVPPIPLAFSRRRPKCPFWEVPLNLWGVLWYGGVRWLERNWAQGAPLGAGSPGWSESPTPWGQRGSWDPAQVWGGHRPWNGSAVTGHASQAFKNLEGARGVSTEQPCWRWDFQKSGCSGWFWHNPVPTVTHGVKTPGMVSEKLLILFVYKITATTRNVFRWCLQTLWEQHFQRQAGKRKSQVLGRTCPPLPQPPERSPKAVCRSCAAQGWGAGHTLHLSDLQVTFAALHFHFPRHRYRGELFVISCQDHGMSLYCQILISLPRYQSLCTYPLPGKRNSTETITTHWNPHE